MRSCAVIFFLLLPFIIGAQFNTQSSGAWGGHGTSLIDLSRSIVQTNLLNSAGLPSHQTYFAIRESYSNIKGSPYWHSEEVTADLVRTDDMLVEDIPVQYDVYLDEVVVTKDDGDEIVLDTRFYKTMIIGEGIEKTIFEKVHPTNRSKFYQILYRNDHIVFFKDVDAKLRNFEIRTINGVTDNKSFKSGNEYYVLIDEKVIKVKLRKKDFLNKMPVLEAYKMRQIAKRDKLKLKTERDFAYWLAKTYH